MYGWGSSDIITISGLAVKVYTAYKDTPDNHRHISGSEEASSLQILRHIESATLDNGDQQEGPELLKGCQSILENLNSLIEKEGGLISTNTSQGFEKIGPGAEVIATMRARLIFNAILLNSFIQRFLFPGCYY